MSDLVLDASLALQWFLEDEAGRQYGLTILASLSTKRAVVPMRYYRHNLLAAQRWGTESLLFDDRSAEG